MKTEFRDVVVKQPVYIADDGKEFDDEDECSDYEFNCMEKTLTYYNHNCEQTDDVMACDIIELSTATDVKVFKHICNICDILDDGIDKPGLYVYGPMERWINIDDVIFKLRGEKNDQN